MCHAESVMSSSREKPLNHLSVRHPSRSKKLKDYDGEGYSVRDGIVVVHKNAVIPDGTWI